MNVESVSRVTGQSPSSGGIGHKSIRPAAQVEVILLAVLIGVAALSRLIFASHTLYHFDSVNFALALDHFDVRIDQPHMPGYILYVWLAQLANAVLHDPNAALVGLSVLGSALAVAAMWALGRAMLGRQAGWIAALLLLTSPLFWFYGEIALPHALDLLGVTVSAWLLYGVRRGRFERLPWAALALGLTGGLRPQTLAFLLPLVVFATWRAPRRQLMQSALLLCLICLAWLAPLLAATGGPGAYLALLARFSGAYQDATSIFGSGGLWGLSRNIAKLAQYAAYAWGAGLLPIILLGSATASLRLGFPLPPVGDFVPPEDGDCFAGQAWRWPKRAQPTQIAIPKSPFQNRQRTWFITIWIAPALAYYALIHMGQQGLVFVFLPALLLISAAACVRLGRQLSGGHWLPAPLTTRSGPRIAWLAGSLAVLNTLVFVLAPEFPLGQDSVRLLTRATIERQDRDMQTRSDAIRSTYSTGQVVVVAAQWRHAEYYLAEYPVLRFGLVNRWEREGSLPVERPTIAYRLSDLNLDAKGAAVVLFDPELADHHRAASPARPASVGGGSLIALAWRPDQILWMDRDGFGLRPARSMGVGVWGCGRGVTCRAGRSASTRLVNASAKASTPSQDAAFAKVQPTATPLAHEGGGIGQPKLDRDATALLFVSGVPVIVLAAVVWILRRSRARS